jgi:hypothetical protein
VPCILSFNVSKCNYADNLLQSVKVNITNLQKWITGLSSLHSNISILHARKALVRHSRCC